MKQTLQKIKEHHSRKQKSNDAFALRCFIPSSTCNKPISRQLSYKVINNNRTCFGLWKSGLKWKQWRVKKEEDQILKTRSKVKSKLFLKLLLFLFLYFLRIFDCQCKTLNINIKFWISIWKPGRLPKFCRISLKFPNKKSKALSLSENKAFRKNDLKANCSCFAELMGKLV